MLVICHICTDSNWSNIWVKRSLIVHQMPKENIEKGFFFGQNFQI